MTASSQGSDFCQRALRIVASGRLQGKIGRRLRGRIARIGRIGPISPINSILLAWPRLAGSLRLKPGLAPENNGVAQAYLAKSCLGDRAPMLLQPSIAIAHPRLLKRIAAGSARCLLAFGVIAM